MMLAKPKLPSDTLSNLALWSWVSCNETNEVPVDLTGIS